MTHFIKKTLLSVGALATISGGLVAPVFADNLHSSVTEQAVTKHVKELGGNFTKKKYNIKGQWQIIEEEGQRILRLSDAFKTKSGPDLKLFLSPQTVHDVTGKTAIDEAVLISALKTNKGGQDYIIPASVNLSDFQSVLIHCEAYSVLWGGSDL